MTFVRKAARGVLKLVVRLASSDSRTWAEAMLGELGSIESDWVAVRWAFGSMYVLLTYPTDCALTMSGIPAEAKALTSRMTQRTWVGGAVVTAMALWFARLVLRVPSSLQRMGCALLVVGMLYLLCQLVSARPRRGDRGTDLAAQAARYGSELGREWNFHRGVSFWSRLAVVVPGFVLLAIGRMIANPAGAATDAIELALFLLFGGLAIPNNQRYANRYAARLHKLEQLQHKP